MTRSSDALVAMDAADGATETVVAPPPTPGTPRYAAVRGYLALLEEISRQHGLSLAEIFGGTRTSRHVVARERAATALRAAGESMSEIGRILGVHHTTIVKLLNGTRGR